VGAFEGHRLLVSSVAFSEKGNLLVTGSSDGTAVLWDIATNRKIRVFKHGNWGVNSVALSADGKRLVSGGEDKTVRLWDLAAGKKIREFKHKAVTYALTLSGDGKLLATGGASAWGRHLWDAEVWLWDVAGGEQIRVLDGYRHLVSCVAFSDDRKWLVTGSFD